MEPSIGCSQVALTVNDQNGPSQSEPVASQSWEWSVWSKLMLKATVKKLHNVPGVVCFKPVFALLFTRTQLKTKRKGYVSSLSIASAWAPSINDREKNFGWYIFFLCFEIFSWWRSNTEFKVRFCVRHLLYLKENDRFRSLFFLAIKVAWPHCSGFAGDKKAQQQAMSFSCLSLGCFEENVSPLLLLHRANGWEEKTEKEKGRQCRSEY